jgi:3-deoxy-D-manno-octulosonate 8-phosphate phosphatase (KDO 8-P phosphatase)
VAYDPLAQLDPAIVERARRVRMVCLDVDGTLTDGRLYFDSFGKETKAFNVLDGQGLVQLRRHGFQVVLITGRSSLVAQNRGSELGLETHDAVKDKLGLLDRLLQREGLAREQMCFMGDDLPDLDCLRVAGLAVAPANAHPWISELVHWVTPAGGGEGATRQLCDVLLAAHGHVPGILAGQHGSRDGRSA